MGFKCWLWLTLSDNKQLAFSESTHCMCIWVESSCQLYEARVYEAFTVRRWGTESSHIWGRAGDLNSAPPTNLSSGIMHLTVNSQQKTPETWGVQASSTPSGTNMITAEQHQWQTATVLGLALNWPDSDSESSFLTWHQTKRDKHSHTAIVLSGYLVYCLKQPAAVERSLLPPCQVNAVLGNITCFCGHEIIISWSDSPCQGDSMENNCHLPVLLPMLSILLISWALNWAGANSNAVQMPDRQSGWDLPRIVGR